MTIKTTPKVQGIFPIIATLTQQARELIRKRPGIYKGNLRYWLMEKNPEVTDDKIKLAFNQLKKESYFFSYEDTVHPPGTVDEQIQLLTKFIYWKRLSFTDYGILYELHTTKGFKRLSEFSREVVSQGWGENEREVKLRLQELLLKHIIKEHNQSITINWDYIRRAVG